MRTYYLSLIDGSRKGLTAVCLRAVLQGLSWVYRAAVVFARWAYRRGLVQSYDLGCPVISVGNMTWGGTGKTPLVERLVNDLLAMGKHPAVLTRGYMPSSSSGNPAGSSDEAAVLRESFGGRVPVIACRNRVQGALCVPPDYPRDVFILDDGFQHWRVRRSLDIVVVDALNPFGNGAVIPRGSLREPLSALKYADVCVISRADLAPEAVSMIREKITAVVPGMRFAEAAHQPAALDDLKTGERRELTHIHNRPVILVSGIGSPSGFELTARSLGAQIRHHLIYPDHWSYQSLDIQQILFCMEKYGARDILTTAKDAVKLKPLMDEFPDGTGIFSLAIEMRVLNGQEVLSDAVISIFHA